jgi:hypothetical protein
MTRALRHEHQCEVRQISRKAPETAVSTRNVAVGVAGGGGGLLGSALESSRHGHEGALRAVEVIDQIATWAGAEPVSA